MTIPLPPSAPSTKVRKLTVLSRHLPRVGKPRYIQVPDIHLRGKWLAAQGFRSGHTIDITCEDGKLIITLSENQRFAGV